MGRAQEALKVVYSCSYSREEQVRNYDEFLNVLAKSVYKFMESQGALTYERGEGRIAGGVK